MILELDVVRLVKSKPEQGLDCGATGTVVNVFGEQEAFEIDFANDDDTNRTITIISREEFELIGCDETEYLTRSEENRERLLTSIRQIECGEGDLIRVDDLDPMLEIAGTK